MSNRIAAAVAISDCDDDGKRKTKRGRSKRRFMDAVREDMAVVEVTEKDAKDQMQMENPLWQPLTVEAERRRR